MSQEKAANAAGLSPTWLGVVERNRNPNPTVMNLEKILAVYGYELDAVKILEE